jgi:spermidine/putrescine-binding protein
MEKYRTRNLGTVAPLSRRQVTAGMLWAGASAAAGGLPMRSARAATDVYWMGWQGYDECFHAQGYLKDNDITFNTTYISSNEELITKLQAGGLGKYDVSTMSFWYLHLMAQAGLLEPIDESLIDSWTAGKLLPEFRELDDLRWDGKLWGVPWTWGTLPCMYDPAAIAAPKRWKDLWDDKLKGKIAMIHDPLGNLYVWIPVITGNRTPHLSTHAQVKETIDALIDLKKNHARAFAQGYGEAADMFARNEVVVSALGWEAMVGFAAEKGKVIDFVIPEEGTLMFMDCLIIPKRSPRPDIAYDLANVCLSTEAQVGLAASLGQAIVNLDAIPLVSQENRDMYRYDDMSVIAKKATLHPIPPSEPDGTHATHDDWLEEYDRLLKA